MLALTKRWRVALLVGPALLLALVVAGLLRLAWNFVQGVENPYVASTVCAPRDGSFKQARISAVGVIPRHADIAQRFSAELVVIGNAGQRLVLRLEVSSAIELVEPAPDAGLSSGAELVGETLLRCFEAVGKPVPTDPREAALAEQAAVELIEILRNSGAGPKGGPTSGAYFEVVSYSSHYTRL